MYLCCDRRLVSRARLQLFCAKIFFDFQVRGSQVLEAARLHRLGFPESVPLNEFVRRFGLLNDTTMPKESVSVESILSANEIDSSTFRVGPSQVSPTP